MLQDHLVQVCTARCFLKSSGIRASRCGTLDAHHTDQRALQGLVTSPGTRCVPILGSNEIHLLSPRHAEHLSCCHYHWGEKNKDRCLLKGLERWPRSRERSWRGNQVQFPAPVSNGSQLPVTQLEDLALSSGIHRHMHVHCTRTQTDKTDWQTHPETHPDTDTQRDRQTVSTEVWNFMNLWAMTLFFFSNHIIFIE